MSGKHTERYRLHGLHANGLVSQKVTLTPAQLAGKTLLHFGAVDYESIVWVNGTQAGTHKGGYTSFALDITENVHDGENEIIVCAKDDNRSGKQPRGKQSENFHSQGCDYTRTTGIWQTVWLEFVPVKYIKRVEYYPDIHGKQLAIKAVTAPVMLHGLNQPLK